MLPLFSPDDFGFIAAALTTIAFLPQVIKTWRTRKAEDVSIVMLLLFIAGLLFWIILCDTNKRSSSINCQYHYFYIECDHPNFEVDL